MEFNCDQLLEKYAFSKSNSVLIDHLQFEPVLEAEALALLMAPAVLTVLLLLPLAILARAQSSITSGSFLTAADRNSLLKSPSGDFAFGFRKIGDEGFLLSIWFDKIAEQTVIWSANGDSLAPEGSRLELTSDGRLVLSDPRGEQIWAPTGMDSRASHASMLDTGNFMVADDTGFKLWESFSQPSDTIVPTQTLVQGTSIFSRYSATNYSRGRFQLSMQRDGNLVMQTIPVPAVYPSNNVYWSTSTGNGDRVIFNRTGQIYLISTDGAVLNTIMSSTVRDMYQRAVIDYDGVFRQYVYPRNSSSRAMGWFTVSLPVPPNICTSMQQTIGVGACGFNSFCILGGDQRPTCKCPDGYVYIDPSNEMNGCKRDFVPQSCDGGMPETDSFVMQEMINANWPYNDYERIVNQDEESCRQACLNDCFCDVVILETDSVCWKKRMPFSNGMVDPDVGAKAFIKVRTSNSTSKIPLGSPKRKDNRPIIIVGLAILSSSAALNLILLLLTFLIWFGYVHGKKAKTVQPCPEDGFTSMQSFTYKELQEATGGFKEELGRGAFGAVYKGVLPYSERSVVAVKVLEKMTFEGEREFKTEVSTIGRTNHRNLVELIGFCNEGQNRLLVYEYMPSGSLADFLFGGSRPSWFKRIEIACGVARGLLYLHEESSKQIIHCDIKPQNILLDESLTVKICDFGLAKLLMRGQTRTMTAVRGTKGYLAPEWFRNMPVSAKVDVYSFGIVLLELICCRKNCEFELSDESQMILSDWVYDCYHGGRLNLIVEGDDEALEDMKRVQRFVMVALWCIQEDPSLRPPMKKVAQMLDGAVEVSVPPEPSSFISSI